MAVAEECDIIHKGRIIAWAINIQCSDGHKIPPKEKHLKSKTTERIYLKKRRKIGEETSDIIHKGSRLSVAINIQCSGRRRRRRLHRELLYSACLPCYALAIIHVLSEQILGRQLIYSGSGEERWQATVRCIELWEGGQCSLC